MPADSGDGGVPVSTRTDSSAGRAGAGARDAAALHEEKAPSPPRPCLHGERGVAGHNPVEIVEDVAAVRFDGIDIFGAPPCVSPSKSGSPLGVKTVLGAGCVFAVLVWSDLRLKARSGSARD